VRVAYFTAGTVGAGHLVRGLAIGRGLTRAGFTGTYRMFGPRLPFPLAAAEERYESVAIQTDPALRQRHLAQSSELAERLRTYQPDLLLVDLFWAPLYWVLPGLGCPAWLLLRLCPPVWLQGPPGMPFDRGMFDRIVGIEPIGLPVLDDVVDPIVIANPGECRPPGALRERLGLTADARLAVVLHAGERGETERLQEAAAGESVTVLDLFQPDAPFPAAEWLTGADRIFAAAGYNAFWEARWLGYAGRTTFLPFPRSIDDQAKRLADFGNYDPKENGADTLARWILDVD
jgi:hypothetical protein